MFITDKNFVNLDKFILINTSKGEFYIIRQNHIYKYFKNRLLYGPARFYLLKIDVS